MLINIHTCRDPYLCLICVLKNHCSFNGHLPFLLSGVWLINIVVVVVGLEYRADKFATPARHMQLGLQKLHKINTWRYNVCVLRAEHVSGAENGAEGGRKPTWAERSGARGSKKTSGAWAEREIVGTGTERWAGKICCWNSAPPYYCSTVKRRVSE